MNWVRIFICFAVLGLILTGCGKSLSATPATKNPTDQTGGTYTLNEQNGGFAEGTCPTNAFSFSNDSLQLSTSGISKGTADFFSRVFEAPSLVEWDTFSWVPDRPYYKNLPNNGVSETAYTDGNANMSGNVLLLHFDEPANATTFEDASPLAASATCTSTACPTTGVTGKLGLGAKFASTSQITVPAATGLRVEPQKTGLTIETWLELSVAPTASTMILDLIGTTGDCGFALFFDTPTTIRAADACGHGISFSYTFTVGTMYHVAVSIAPASGSTEEETLYINGAKVSAQSSSAWTSNTLWTSLSIGKSPNATTDPSFQGYLDELAVFSRPLTATEIQDHYYRGALRVGFQVRSCPTSGCTMPYIGPDGTVNSYFTEFQSATTGLPSVSLQGVLPNNPYLQYQAIFSTDTDVSPLVSNVMAEGTL